MTIRTRQPRAARNLIELHPGDRQFGARADASADLSGINAAVERLNRTFGEFRESNDRRLREIEARGATDVVTGEKVDRINGELTRLDISLRELNEATAAARSGVGNSGATESAAVRSYNAAFGEFFRRGSREGELNTLAAQAALQTDSNPDGGYLLPPAMEDAMTRALTARSTMRQLADVQTVGAGGMVALHNVGGTDSGWIGERGARPQTNTSQFVKIEFPMGEIYAMPAATARMLEDASINVEAWISSEVDITMAAQEGAAFFTGDGIDKPRGLISAANTYAAQPTTTAGTSSWDAVNFIKSGAAATLGTDPYDAVIDLIHALRTEYRNSATFISTDLTLAALRKVKDGEDNYIWQPSIQAGMPSQLLGYGYSTDDNMHDIGANNFPLAFGDFKRAYRVLDRRGATLLRDPYSNKPYVLFYITKRVGGGIRDHKAYKLLKCAA